MVMFGNVVLCLLFIAGKTVVSKGVTQDQTSPRSNTLFDDADDIQRQLDNEARDRIMYGRPKTVWVLHLPTRPRPTSTWHRQFRSSNLFRKSTKTLKNFATKDKNSWTYKEQNTWSNLYPECGGRSQSPVDIPAEGLIRTRGARPIQFTNYDGVPNCLTLKNYGNRITLTGDWKDRPLVHGGATHSRRYLFHSLTLHWPSEHTVGGLLYPLETHAIHVSAEYNTWDQAIEAAPRDPQSLLGIANLYKYDNHTHKGIVDLMKTLEGIPRLNCSVTGKPLSHFNPTLKEYACYQGSLTTPPCTENVLWLVRARALPITREAAKVLNGLVGPDGELRKLSRHSQTLNDRKIYFFDQRNVP